MLTSGAAGRSVEFMDISTNPAPVSVAKLIAHALSEPPDPARLVPVLGPTGWACLPLWAGETTPLEDCYLHAVSELSDGTLVRHPRAWWDDRPWTTLEEVAADPRCRILSAEVAARIRREIGAGLCLVYDPGAMTRYDGIEPGTFGVAWGLGATVDDAQADAARRTGVWWRGLAAGRMAPGECPPPSLGVRRSKSGQPWSRW